MAKPSEHSPLHVSTVHPSHFDLVGYSKLIVCPACGTWRKVNRGMIVAHHGRAASRCVNSNRRVVFDVTLAQRSARLGSLIDPSSRHGTAAHGVAVPGQYLTPEPLHRIARRA